MGSAKNENRSLNFHAGTKSDRTKLLPNVLKLTKM